LEFWRLYFNVLAKVYFFKFIQCAEDGCRRLEGRHHARTFVPGGKTLAPPLLLPPSLNWRQIVHFTSNVVNASD